MARFWEDLGKINVVSMFEKLLMGKNSDGVTMYCDVQQLYDTISTKNFQDVKPSVVSSGTNLGTPTKLTAHVVSAGTYITPAGNLTVTGNINFFFWDLSSWTWIQFDVAVKDNTITTAKIVDGSVNTAKLADASVSSGKIVDLAVTSVKIGDGAVLEVKIANGAVTNTKLADASVSTSKIIDLAVTGAKVALDAITTSKILDLAVTAAKIATGAIIESKLADYAVTAIKIATNTITKNKLIQSLIAEIQNGRDVSNILYVNRFNKFSKDIIAGYIDKAGTIVPSGTIANGQIIVTPYIEVKSGETLYLSAFANNASLLCFYDKDFNIVNNAANMSATFVVPIDGYIRFSLTWSETAYISTQNRYIEFGLTSTNQNTKYSTDRPSMAFWRSQMELFGTSPNIYFNYTAEITINSFGDFTGGQHPNNKVSILIPICPSSSLKLITGITFNNQAIFAEYDLNNKFIQKTNIIDDRTANGYYRINASSSTYYIRLEYNTASTVLFPLQYISGQTYLSNFKPNASIADKAYSLLSSISLKNVSKFLTTVTPQGTGLTIEADLVNGGFIFTCVNASGHYAIWNTLDLLENERYQQTIEYELIDLNCTSVDLRSTAYFASSSQKTISLNYLNVNKKNTFTRKSITASGTNNTNGLSLICQGSKIDTGKAYFAKIRVTKSSLITYLDALENVQNIEKVFGNITEGTEKYLNYSDLDTYYKHSNIENYKGYNLFRADDVEITNRNMKESSYSIGFSTGLTALDVQMDFSLPSYFLNKYAYAYYRFEVTLNSLNSDRTSVRFRTLSGDEFVVFTPADIGVKKVINIMRYNNFTSVTNSSYVTIRRDLTFINNVVGGYDATVDIGITIHSATMYVSEKKMPVLYNANFFKENNTDFLLTKYVKEPIKKLKLNAYGHSIIEQNFMKYIGVEGYDFDINIYGLRSTVSNVSNPTPGCDTYTVMTDDADIVLTMFGQHDFGRNVPLGLIGTLDKGTYIGAYEVLIRGLIEKYPQREIVVITDTPRNLTNNDNEFFNQKNALNLTMRDYAEALIKLSNFYAITVVDTNAEIDVNYLTMTGHPNLYVSTNGTNNTKIDSAGALISDSTYFISELIPVSQLKRYGCPSACQYAEYNSSDVFIRLHYSSSRLYQHKDTAKVRLVVQKSSTVIDGTTIGVDFTRFWFADLADAKMQDRIHPDEISKRTMGIEIGKKLERKLKAQENTTFYHSAIFNNAD